MKRKSEVEDGVITGAVVDSGNGLFPDSRPASSSDKRSRLRITIPLTEDGREIDGAAFRQASQERLRAVLEENPRALQMYAPAGETVVASGAGVITEWHVNLLLNVDEMAKKWAFPLYIKGQTQGKVKIPTEIANRAFTFTPEQREQLIPVFVKFLNQALPDWALKWIGKAGAGGEAITLYLMISWMQCRLCLDLTNEAFGRQTIEPQKANGHAVEQPL